MEDARQSGLAIMARGLARASGDQITASRSGGAGSLCHAEFANDLDMRNTFAAIERNMSAIQDHGRFPGDFFVLYRNSARDARRGLTSGTDNSSNRWACCLSMAERGKGFLALQYHQ